MPTPIHQRYQDKQPAKQSMTSILTYSFSLSLFSFSAQVIPADKTPFFLYMLWPPFAFYRLLQYFNLACLSMQCYGIDILSPSGGLNLVTTAMVYLGGSTVVLMIVSVYLSFVLPSEYGVRKNPFFPIIGKNIYNNIWLFVEMVVQYGWKYWQ